MVAPSSTAISKSPLIPIDSSGSPWRSASLRSERNQPRASSARSTAGGIAISPRSRSPPSFVSASTAVSTASGGQPPFDGSRPTLTCTSASTGRPRARARRSSSRARSMRSTEWTTSNSSSASRTLFVWRWPTRCHATGRPSSATLPRASCTRFSPSAVSPAARAARMRATSTVLDTPTSSTSSARRPARSAARAMRSRTRSRLVRMSCCISSTGDSSTRFCYPRNVMPPLSDLALMIQSRYPFIAVETSEEDRLETTLSQVAGDLRVPFFVWTVTNGLHRHGLPNAIYDSQQPLKGLNNVAAMTGEALFLMKDLHRYLTDPAVVRKYSVLEYSSPEEDLAEVGGFKNLKALLAKRKKAFTPEAKTFGIDPGRGILLLGVQGCLRGDSRVLLADGRMPTLESLARQVSDCLEPGAYDVAYRVALDDGKTGRATKLHIHANRETVLVRFAGARELELTPGHEALTSTGWKPAGKLKADDDVKLWHRTQDMITPPKR